MASLATAPWSTKRATTPAPAPSPGEAEPWDVYVTGHSLGGALSTLCTYDVASRKWEAKGIQRPRVTCYTFGQPRVVNRPFAETVSACVHACAHICRAVGRWHPLRAQHGTMCSCKLHRCAPTDPVPPLSHLSL